VEILVDSNVLLDVLTEDEEWFEWSAGRIAHHAERDILGINPLIYSEVSIHCSMMEEIEEALPSSQFVRFQLPWEAAFLAGRCFLQYRKRGGQRRSPLPDFYIGAHASISGYALLTRDAARYRTYFPKLKLITPEK
jgi:predicted nucleic acid-binding protein